MPPFSKLSLVLPATLMLWAAACEEPCRYDADCSTSAGLTRCNVDTGACEPLMPMAVASCAGADECQGGRVCAAGECRFAPSCQRVTDAASFDYIARCSTGEIATGTATATTNGCRVEFTLADVFGQPLSLVLEPISATSEGDAEIATSSEGQVSCPAGTWSAPYSAASLPGCSLPGGQTCDVGILRQNAGPICLADGSGCSAGTTCEPFGPGASDVGGCR